MSYANEWVAAVERSQRFGLSVPGHQVEPGKRYLDAQRLADFPHVMQKGLGQIRPDDLVLQCMSIHMRMAPVVEEWLGCPAIYTLGWIDDGTPRGMFKFDEEFIATKLQTGHKGGTLNLHAWLTLPSMEIIDVSLATTIAVVQKLSSGRGAVMAGNPDYYRGFAYKPMLAGAEFLFKTGVAVEFNVYSAQR